MGSCAPLDIILEGSQFKRSIQYSDQYEGVWNTKLEEEEERRKIWIIEKENSNNINTVVVDTPPRLFLIINYILYGFHVLHSSLWPFFI